VVTHQLQVERSVSEDRHCRSTWKWSFAGKQDGSDYEGCLGHKLGCCIC